MKVIEKKVSDLIPYEKNPRKNEEAVDLVKNSIEQFGFKVPIVIDTDNVIVTGHTRLKAAKKLGMEKVPCIIADDLNEEQIKAFRLADNSVAQYAMWDFDLLTDELKELDELGNIDMNAFGFNMDAVLNPPAEIVEDDAPAMDFISNAEYIWSNMLIQYFDRDRSIPPFDFPLLQPTDEFDLPDEFLDFNNLPYYERNVPKAHEFGIRFYQDDNKEDKIWRNPEHWLKYLREYKCVVMPDFSTYRDMPAITCLFNIYRSFLIGQIIQDNGIPLIIDLSAFDSDRFGSIVDGLYPKNSYYAISTKGFANDKEIMDEIKHMLDRVLAEFNPKGILLFGNDVKDYDWTKWEGIEKRVYACPQFYNRRKKKGGKKDGNKGLQG